jgi:hypothetical protein
LNIIAIIPKVITQKFSPFSNSVTTTATAYYWTFLFYPQTYKVFGNLIGLDFRKCPVVWFSP